MKRLAILLLFPLLGGCAAKAMVETAVTAVTMPVKAASQAIDLATTSQSEADEKRGRGLGNRLRKASDDRARLASGYVPLAGFLRRAPVRLAKAVTCDLEVPAESEFVIEGYIDLKMEEVMRYETTPHPVEFVMYYSA